MNQSASYDIVLATRNRPDVLKLSLPLFMAQTQRAQKLIVVDGSDDPKPVRHYVDSIRAPKGLRIILLQSAPGLPAQRNLGLEHSAADVVLFPDDDTLLYQDAAQRVMALYESDSQQMIAGIAFEEIRTPPAIVCDRIADQHHPLRDRLIYRFSPLRASVEQLICPSPFVLLGKRGNDHHRRGKSLPGGARAVPFMHGFRMTYRRAIIARHRFDQSMDGYALYEDINASFAVQQEGMLVEASRAMAYHHRVPGQRASPRHTGAMLALNIIYVICRHTAAGDPLRQLIEPYLRLRAWQYYLRRGGDFGQRRYAAFMDSLQHLNTLVAVSPEKLPETYELVMKEVLAGQAAKSATDLFYRSPRHTQPRPLH